jgi:hypothetical protein
VRSARIPQVELFVWQHILYAFDSVVTRFINEHILSSDMNNFGFKL